MDSNHAGSQRSLQLRAVGRSRTCHARGSGPEGEKEVARGRCLEIRLCHCDVTMETYCHEDKTVGVPRVRQLRQSCGQEARSSGAGCLCT